MQTTYWLIILWGAIALLTLCVIVYVLRPLRANRHAWQIGLIVPIVAVMLYMHWGGSRALTRYWAVKAVLPKARAMMAKIHDPQQLIAMFKQQLKRAPYDAKGWYLLGRLYLSQRDYQHALDAFKRARHLRLVHLASVHRKKDEFNDTLLIVYWARAHMLASVQPLPKSVVSALQQCLKQDAACAPALNLLALNAYRHHDYPLAIRYWERVLPLLPAESKDRQAVLKMLAMVEHQA